MSNESLSHHIHHNDASYWQNILKGLPVTISSPDAFRPDQGGHFDDMSSVTGNPFANGFEDNFDSCVSHNDHVTIITPIPPQDASGNRLELKLKRAPKIDPPPEFRNSRSYRDSQYSVQSSDSVSSQDMNLIVGGFGDGGEFFTNNTNSSAFVAQHQKSGNNASQTQDHIPSSEQQLNTTAAENERPNQDSDTFEHRAMGSSNTKDSSESQQKVSPNAGKISDITDKGSTSRTGQSHIPRSNSFQAPKKSFAGMPTHGTKKSATLNGRGRPGQDSHFQTQLGLFAETSSVNIKPAPPPPPPRTIDRLSSDEFSKSK